MEDERTYTAFDGNTRIASGPLSAVLPVLRAADPGQSLLVFEDQTGRQLDVDLRGGLPRANPGPGRPKLGVVAREISLLPRHWDWLEQQPNGASAAIRRLVDDARRRDPDKQRARLARDAANRFLSAMAGNLPGYEEATRALYAIDRERFESLILDWPADIRRHAQQMVADAFV